MSLSFCRTCGEPIRPGVSSCPTCGRALIAGGASLREREQRIAESGSRLVGAVGVFMSAALLIWFAYALTTESLITNGPCNEGALLLVIGFFTQLFGISLAGRALVTGKVPVWAWPLTFAAGLAAAIASGLVSASDCITV